MKLRTLLPLLVFLLLLPLLLFPTYAHAEPTEIRLWHSYRGAEQKALQSIVSDWNESHDDLQVRVLAVPHEAYASKLTSSIPRGQGPDLFIHAHERVGDWANSKLIEPVDEEETSLDRFVPVTVDALTYEEEVWGLPLAFKSVALFYNKALVDQPPATTDELLEVARRHTGGGGDSFGLAYQADAFYFHAPWLFGFGGGIFQEGEVRLDRPANAASFRFVADMLDEGLMPEEPTGALVANLFNEGRTAMVIQGPWFLGSVKEEVDFGIAPLPEVSSTGQRATPFLTVDAAIVSAHSNHKSAARRFARHLAVGPAVATRLQEGKQLVARADVWDGATDLARDEHLAAFRRQADHARPMPNDPLMRSVWEPSSRALRGVLRGDLTPEQAVEKAQSQFDIVTRPPPDQKDPTGYLILFGLLLVGVCGWLVWRVRKRGGMGALKEAKTAYSYLAPGAVALVLLVFVPFLVGTAVSLFAHEGGEFTFVGLANFWSILSSADYAVGDPLSFYFTLGVTVMWTVVNVVLHVGIGLAVALVLRNSWIRLKGVWRVLLIVPWAVPNYITALIWKGMFHSQFGAINGLLEFLGLEPVPWFSNFWTAFAANVTTNTWLGFPFMMVVSLGALQAIPQDLEEAARMDGAGWGTRFVHVIWPQIKPALVPAVILGSVWTFNMFNIIYLVSGGAPGGSTEILISEAYRWAFSRQEQYGYAAAYATLIFMVLVGYSLLTEQVTGKLEE